jgi:hypothetical protein
MAGSTGLLGVSEGRAEGVAEYIELRLARHCRSGPLPMAISITKPKFYGIIRSKSQICGPSRQSKDLFELRHFILVSVPASLAHQISSCPEAPDQCSTQVFKHEPPPQAFEILGPIITSCLVVNAETPF